MEKRVDVEKRLNLEKEKLQKLDIFIEQDIEVHINHYCGKCNTLNLWSCNESLSSCIIKNTHKFYEDWKDTEINDFRTFCGKCFLENPDRKIKSIIQVSIPSWMH